MLTFIFLYDKITQFKYNNDYLKLFDCGYCLLLLKDNLEYGLNHAHLTSAATGSQEEKN